MVIYMKEIGEMIKPMDLVFIFMSMELNLKEIGKMIYKMAKE